MPASSELAPLATPPELITQVPDFGAPEQAALITGVPDFAKSDNPFLTASGFNIGSFTQGDYQAHKQIEGIKSPWDTAETITGMVKAPSLAALQIGHTAFNMAVDYIGGEEVISQERAKLGMMKKLGNYVTGKFAQLKLGKDNSAAVAFAAQTPMNEMKAWSSLVLPPAIEAFEDTPGYQSAINLETASKTVELLETQNFVAEAPKFADQLTDESRTNKFTYVKTGIAKWNEDPKKFEQQVTLTEHEGLVQLAEFLDTAAAELPDTAERLIEQAKGIRENLTFIGSKEYQEAAAGLAKLWKAHLDSDPALQLCIPAKISERGGKRKSDVHLFENILSTFSDEELKQYSGRILTNIKDITEAPDHTKIILLDDWSISGSQAREAYSDMSADPKFSEYRKSLEVNLLVSSQDRLENGLRTQIWDSNSFAVPVKAYFKAHDAASTSTREHKAHVTGIHSSVDFDFEQMIGDMVTALRHDAFQKTGTDVAEINMPPVTNVVREYRHAKPLIKKTKSGTFKRKKV